MNRYSRRSINGHVLYVDVDPTTELMHMHGTWFDTAVWERFDISKVREFVRRTDEAPVSHNLKTLVELGFEIVD